MATKTITGVGIGTTTITASYGGKTATASITVSKAAGSVKTAPANNGSTYGSGSYLCTTGASDTGTMMYKLGASGTYSSTRPTTSGLNVGSYTLYYKAAASTNYNESSEGSITVTVVQAGGGVTISNANPTYGTSNALASVSGATGTMYYRVGTSGSFSTTMPTASGRDAGSYTLYYYVDASTNYTSYGSSSSPKNLTVTVAKASGSVKTAPTNSAATYGSGSYLCSTGASDTGTMQYKLGSGSYSSTRPTTSGLNAGSYTLYYYAAASTNYNASSEGSITVTVVQAGGSVSISNANPTYGTSNALASVSGNTGTMHYKLDSGSWTTTMPTASGLNAGSYTLYYYVDASTNYTAFGSSSSPKSLTVSVAKAGGSVTTAPTNSAATYGSGSYLCSTGAGTGTMMYRLGSSGDYSSTRPTTSGLNADSYTLYYYAAASTNYNASSTGSITVTVVKAGISPTVTMSGYTYAGTKSNPSVSGNSGGGTVTYYYNTTNSNSNGTAWSNVTSSTSLTAGDYWMYATVGATSNYNGATTPAVKFTISKATGTGSVTMTGWTYGGTVTNPSPSSSTNGTSNVSYTWYNSSKTALTSKPTSTSTPGTYYVKATFAATSNYTAYTTDYVSFTISQRTGAAPTFAASSVSATCVQAGSAVNAGTFTAATAGHSGSITYSIVSVVEDGTSTQLTGWTMTSNTSRVITVPANTVGGKTYKVTVRASEGATTTDTASSKDAVITVTLNKGSQTLNLDKTELTVTVGGSTGTITASGYSGTLSVTSGTPGVATATNAAASTITAVKAGTSTITFTAAATNYVNAVSKTATVTVNRRTGAAPTFAASTVTATCSQDQSAKTTSAFGAATAGHSGTLSYSLVSAKNSGGTSLSDWSVNSSNRTIGIPANTVSGTYTVVVRCTEAQTDYDTSSTKDATITVTLSKGTQTLNLDKTELALTVPNTGTIKASGYAGTLSVSSGSTSIATASNSATSTITAVSAGSATITFTAAATDYVNAASKTATVTVSRRAGAAPTFANGTATATCSQDQSAKTTSAFGTATAGHSGTLSYSLVSAKNSGGSTLSSWSVTSSTRKINIPANTVAGTYTCVVRATEAETSTDTSSYTDATITVTLSKGTQSLTLTGSPTNYTTTYSNGGTITASGHAGAISASSGTTSVATVSVSGSKVTVTCVKAGSSVITVTAAANDYVESVSKTVTWTISKANSTACSVFEGDSKGYDSAPASLTYSGYSGGTIQFRSDANGGTSYGSATTTAPTRSTVGTTRVQYRIVGDENHNDIDWTPADGVTLTVNAETDAHMTVTLTPRTYNTNSQVIATGGDFHAVSTYKIGYIRVNIGATAPSTPTADSQITWAANDSSLSATNAGDYYVYYTMSPGTGHTNSRTREFVGKVTISKAGRSGAVSCNNVTYGSTVTASVSGNTESGTVTWGITPGTGTATINSSGVVTPTKAGTVTVTASVAETANYAAYTATSKQITISKAQGTITYSTSESASTYCTSTAAAVSKTDANKTITIATSSASNATGTISYSISKSGWSIASDGKTITVPANTDAGSYEITVSATSAATDNYEAKTVTNNITITLTATVVTGLVLALTANTISYGGSTTVASVVATYNNGATVDVKDIATYSSSPTGIVEIS